MGMIELNLFGEDAVCSSSDKSGGESPEMLAGERIELCHYVSVGKTLHIMAEPNETFDPHAGLSTNRARKLVLKISYDKYSFCLAHPGAKVLLLSSGSAFSLIAMFLVWVYSNNVIFNLASPVRVKIRNKGSNASPF
jgi:hypothetical protein